MAETPKAKVIKFPRRTAAPGSTSLLDELKSALAQSEPSKPEAAPPVAQNVTYHVSGNGQVAQGSITNNTYNVSEAPRPLVIVKTGDGVISAAQKAKLLELRDRVVEASAAGKEPQTPASVMFGLKKYMKVNSYAEIALEDFEKAVKWLTRKRAIKNSLKSAKKLPSWRNSRIKAVHARTKERGWETWRLEYMRNKFGKDSMVELSDDDLDILYRAVMAKK